MADRFDVPVIIGEFGVVKRIEESERAEYIAFYTETAEENGIKLVIFDDGCDFTVFDRNNFNWPYPSIISAPFMEE